jgi:hypothetical protein
MVVDQLQSWRVSKGDSMMAVHICTVMVTMCCAAARMSYPNFVTRPAASHKSSRGPCSFSDKLSIEITMRRMASLIASAHSIVPSLQARIQNAARRRITPTKLGSEALALTGGVGRGSYDAVMSKLGHIHCPW